MLRQTQKITYKQEHCSSGTRLTILTVFAVAYWGVEGQSCSEHKHAPDGAIARAGEQAQPTRAAGECGAAGEGSVAQAEGLDLRRALQRSATHEGGGLVHAPVAHA